MSSRTSETQVTRLVLAASAGLRFAISGQDMLQVGKDAFGILNSLSEVAEARVQLPFDITERADTTFY